MAQQHATRYELGNIVLHDARSKTGNLRCIVPQPLDYVVYDDGIWQFRSDGRRLRLHRVALTRSVDVARMLVEARAQ